MAADEARLQELLKRIGALNFYNTRYRRELWNELPNEVQYAEMLEVRDTLKAVSELIMELLSAGNIKN